MIYGFAVWSWWILFAAYLISVQRRRVYVSGLVLAYLLTLSIQYWPGAFVYALPWYDPHHPYLMRFTRETIQTGYFITLLGMFSFLIGSQAYYILFKTAQKKDVQKIISLPPKNESRFMLWYAIIISVILGPVVVGIPSLSTISVGAMSLALSAICLIIYPSVLKRKKIRMLRIMFVSGIFFTIYFVIFKGFMSYAASNMIILISFAMVNYPTKAWKKILMIIAAFYFGLSLATTWMTQRDAVRESVWKEKQSLGDRLGEGAKIVTEFKLLNPFNNEQLENYDIRFNQNSFVGAAYEYLRDGFVPYAKGETLLMAIYSMVPRIMWKDKPIIAGSGNLVSNYTGIPLSESSSFGIGQVMELYINWGISAVAIGHFIFGLFFTFLDNRAAEHLARGGTKVFLQYFIIGISFMAPLAPFMDMTMTAISAYIFSVFFIKFIIPSFIRFK